VECQIHLNGNYRDMDTILCASNIAIFYVIRYIMPSLVSCIRVLFMFLQIPVYGANVVIFEGIMAFVNQEVRDVSLQISIKL